LAACAAFIVYVLSQPMCQPTPCQAAQRADAHLICPAICQSSLVYAYRGPLAFAAAAVVLVVSERLLHLRARAPE
jgi:hypothetical protein